MSVKIRLNRVGGHNAPFYRLIVQDSRCARIGKSLEVLGTYDPLNLTVSRSSSQKEEKGSVQVKTDRVLYWLKQGAEVSDTAKSLIKRLKISAA